MEKAVATMSQKCLGRGEKGIGKVQVGRVVEHAAKIENRTQAKRTRIKTGRYVWAGRKGGGGSGGMGKATHNQACGWVGSHCKRKAQAHNRMSKQRV